MPLYQIAGPVRVTSIPFRADHGRSGQFANCREHRTSRIGCGEDGGALALITRSMRANPKTLFSGSCRGASLGQFAAPALSRANQTSCSSVITLLLVRSLARALNKHQREAGQVTRVVGPSGRSSESGGRYMRNSPKLITLGLAFSLLGSTCALARPALHFKNGRPSCEKMTGHVPTTRISGPARHASRPSSNAVKDDWPANMILD